MDSGKRIQNKVITVGSDRLSQPFDVRIDRSDDDPAGR